MIGSFLRRSIRFLHRYRSDRRGATAAEFALATPLLLLLLSVAVDLGLALNQSSTLSNAARAGAQYAMRYPSDPDGIRLVVTKAVPAELAQLTVASILSCECADGTKTVCTESCNGTAPKSFVSVTVSMPFRSPLPTAMMLGVTTVSGAAVFRAN